MLQNFYYHPRMLDYNFGPQHPLKPIRLKRAIELLEHYGVQCIDPGPGERRDPLRVHSEEYVDAVERISDGNDTDAYSYGFGPGDNPPFPGMYEASLAYNAGSVRAAEAVRDGAPMAFSLSGGLHHARRSIASGFCIFDDPAVACHVLREKFDRVAYVDVDVHHGDGVQWLFYDDPQVMTCSIHQDGRTLYPGTGAVKEHGDSYTSVNVPVMPGTTGDVWLEGFELIEKALDIYRPQAIVLQMGTDTHDLDPLARVRNTAQEWLVSIQRIRDRGLPLVALGGGGYNLMTVTRMWVAACLTLARQEVPELVPEPFASEWGVPRFLGDAPPEPRRGGEAQIAQVAQELEASVFPNIPRTHS